MDRDSYLWDVGSQPSDPPFRFSGVRMRVFPLRASFSRLKEFCDRYLNGFPDVAEFRPIDGFVELIVLEYPSITSVEQPAFATYGQTEVFFMVPVMWKERATGKQHFAVITPYIFVDNPVSARIGRDLFGWPKEAAWYRRDEIGTSASPGAATQLVAIDTEILTSKGSQTSRLIEVDDQPDREWLSFGRQPSTDDLPMDVNGLLRLWSRPWLMAGRGFALWRRALLDLMTQPTRPLQMLNVNLKQFPQMDPEGTAAYQALTVTPLRTTRLNGFGLIGEQKQLLGEPSGGCLIRIYEDPTWPVVTKLGLSYEEATPLSSEPGARLVYRFHPVCPVWCSADFEQHPSRILASRGTPATGALGGTTGPRVPLNTTLGSRTLLGACSGTTLSGVELQLFGLTAEAAPHQKLVEQLNQLEMAYEFELAPLGPTGHSSVLFSVATFEGMRADRLSMPDWHGTLVELFIPVRFRRRSEASWQVALFSEAAFANSNALADSLHDVLGGNAQLAKMRRGDTAEIAQGIDNQLHLFRLSASVVRQYSLGERAKLLPVIDVFGRPRGVLPDVRPEPVVALGGSGPVDFPTLPILRLKQVPSAEDPLQCSYQALVQSEWRGARGAAKDVGIDHELRFFEYDSLNLVSRLGLQHSEPDVEARVAAPTDDFQDQWQVYRRPFAETLLVLTNDVTIQSQVLWERRLA
jgi:hypothetical protein